MRGAASMSFARPPAAIPNFEVSNRGQNVFGQNVFGAVEEISPTRTQSKEARKVMHNEQVSYASFSNAILISVSLELLRSDNVCSIKI